MLTQILCSKVNFLICEFLHREVFFFEMLIAHERQYQKRFAVRSLFETHTLIYWDIHYTLTVENVVWGKGT